VIDVSDPAVPVDGTLAVDWAPAAAPAATLKLFDVPVSSVAGFVAVRVNEPVFVITRPVSVRAPATKDPVVTGAFVSVLVYVFWSAELF
jgi:hypothetical protein